MVALAGFGRERREFRESWLFCLGLILRRADTMKPSRLFFWPFAFGDEFRRPKYFTEKMEAVSRP